MFTPFDPYQDVKTMMTALQPPYAARVGNVMLSVVRRSLDNVRGKSGLVRSRYGKYCVLHDRRTQWLISLFLFFVVTLSTIFRYLAPAVFVKYLSDFVYMFVYKFVPSLTTRTHPVP